jgi:hypothetical protein
MIVIEGGRWALNVAVKERFGVEEKSEFAAKWGWCIVFAIY